MLLGLAALTYLADDLWARSRGRPLEEIKIDRVYADVNHWNQVEYSIGSPILEMCIDSLMPHFGYTPCWYLRRHTLRQIGP
jgi:hypothetical protein